MEKIIKVGIGVLLIKNNQILLGHRIKDGLILVASMNRTHGVYQVENKSIMKLFLKERLEKLKKKLI